MPAYAAALILLLLVQAGLGGVTVLDQNSPWSVALHLSAALLLFSVLWLIFARTGPVVAGPAGAAGPLSIAVWLLALGAMASAAMTTKSGAALACSTWPLCDGALIPDLADPAIRLNFSHRLLALGVGLGALALHIACRAPTRARAACRAGFAADRSPRSRSAASWCCGRCRSPRRSCIRRWAWPSSAPSRSLMWRANAPVSDPRAVHVRSLSRA